MIGLAAADGDTTRAVADVARLASRGYARGRLGYGIPLIEPGKTTNFYPDFLARSDGSAFAIDTKGAHLHADAARELGSIPPADDKSPRVFARHQ